MICLAGNLPPLKVGRQQVVGYATDWIDRALARAAEAAGRGDCPLLNHFGDGVRHYLENRGALRLCPIEDLFARIATMLRKAGCPDIASHLTPLAPPVTVSLIGPARLASRRGARPFFDILDEEIRLLQESGAECIRFCDVEECLYVLEEHPHCPCTREALKQQVVAFLEGRLGGNSIPAPELQLTLDL